MIKSIEFSKLEGAGNDFIIIDNLSGDIRFTQEEIAFLCDRHFGIGADGLILAENSPQANGKFFMRFFNSDSSIAEMCGNGIRCFARYLYDNCLIDDESFTISTLAGPKRVRLIFTDFEITGVEVDMGRFSLRSAEVPVLTDQEFFIDQPIIALGESLNFTAVSIGNPHAVTFVTDIEQAPVTTLGPIIERSPLFPNKTNVEFAKIFNDSLISLRVWERGVGETLSCGTGACATVVAAHRLGLVGKAVTVQLLGGVLEIEILNDNILMTGPASLVFTGQINLK